jgi:hypothetical protein
VEPTITGTLIERPAAAQPLVISPPPTVGSYVVSHPVTPVYLNGEVVEVLRMLRSPRCRVTITNMPMLTSSLFWSNFRRGGSSTYIAERERRCDQQQTNMSEITRTR